ncbi:MAG TPA: M23 family metallopeptidase [Chryseosolibacter sp.]|nr:M23 family metallopeptidase [Chryseosolibacter sp.]
MARKKFIYNNDTCRFEPFYVRGRLFWKRVSVFVGLALMIAAGTYYATITKLDTLSELRLAQRNEDLKFKWSVLTKRVKSAQKKLAGYIEKDDHNYRVILDRQPLEPTIREAGVGGSERYNVRALEAFPYILKGYETLKKIKYQTDVEIQSYQELEKLLDYKLMSWAARPAIQPINNTQLDRLHLTFGLRLHPIFKIVREHKGLDFAAPRNTPVYSSGDGVITHAYYSESFGKVVFIDHGFDFESRYAHLNDFAVTVGDSVKRGQIIGYVGNTGHSVSDHLHYEILFKGDHVNPINFFQRNLSNAEYQKLIDTHSENITSLD